MNTGILMTALSDLPLELEYRAHSGDHGDSSNSGQHLATGALPAAQRELELSDEFACLVSMI